MLQSARQRPLREDSNRPPSINPSPSHIEQVPIELLRLIYHKLEVQDQVCLTLCSHSLLERLGNDCWAMLGPWPYHSLRWSPNHDARHDLMSRLARGVCDQFVCYDCGEMHHLDRVRPPYTEQDDPDDKWYGERYHGPLYCLFVDGLPGILSYPFDTYHPPSIYKLRYQHVQAVMGWHYSNHYYGLGVHALGIVEIRYSERFSGVTSLSSVEPRILDNELCLRVQHWIFPANHCFGWGGILSEEILLCEHARAYNHLADFPYHSRRERKIHHTCFQWHTCPACGIEYRLETKDLGQQGLAVVVTKCLNLGNGSSAADFLWNTRLYNYINRSWNLSRAANWEDSRSPLLSTRFERAHKKPLAVLSNENATLLRTKKYMETFRYRKEGNIIWYQVFDPVSGRKLK